MSVLERCPSYRESNKRSKERQGPTLSVRFTEVSVKRESTVYQFSTLISIQNLRVVKKKSNNFHQEAITMIMLMSFSCIPAKLERI